MIGLHNGANGKVAYLDYKTKEDLISVNLPVAAVVQF